MVGGMRRPCWAGRLGRAGRGERTLNPAKKVTGVLKKAQLLVVPGALDEPDPAPREGRNGPEQKTFRVSLQLRGRA